MRLTEVASTAKSLELYVAFTITSCYPPCTNSNAFWKYSLLLDADFLDVWEDTVFVANTTAKAWTDDIFTGTLLMTFFFNHLLPNRLSKQYQYYLTFLLQQMMH